MRRLPLPLLAASATVLSGLTLGAQQNPTFRSSIETVPIYATVTDDSGRLVPGLEREDFEILDNGVPQELTVFRAEIEPFSAVVALDTSASMTALIPLVQNAAEQFVIRMLPDDQASIAYFNSKVTMSRGLSSDRDSLIEYIHDEMEFGNETLLWDAIDEAMDRLAGVSGRRVVVALTDGDDYGSDLGRGDVLDRARRESVMIYAIGLQSRYFDGIRWRTSNPGGGFRDLAEETGGGYFHLTETADLNTTFTRVIQELHSQYALGFSPEQMDGRVHTLQVRLRQPGMRARARQTYLAASESP